MMSWRYSRCSGLSYFMRHTPIIIIPMVRQPSVLLWDGSQEARDWKGETRNGEARMSKQE